MGKLFPLNGKNPSQTFSAAWRQMSSISMDNIVDCRCLDWNATLVVVQSRWFVEVTHAGFYRKNLAPVVDVGRPIHPALVPRLLCGQRCRIAQPASLEPNSLWPGGSLCCFRTNPRQQEKQVACCGWSLALSGSLDRMLIAKGNTL
jgi:hypothetical protein